MPGMLLLISKKEEKNMVKIRRRDTEKTRLAIKVLEREREKRNGTYNLPEVNEALREIFSGKCYICENKHFVSYQIEHFRPVKGDINRKFDWDNLFLACAHCNSVKGEMYEHLLDCTKVEIDKKIAFRKEGYFGTDEVLKFIPLDQEEETLETVDLLCKVHEGTTLQKKMGATDIKRALRRELSRFKETVREYQEAEGEDKEDYLCLIQIQLKPNSPFTAFKRWLIRDNAKRYPELMKFCE